MAEIHLAEARRRAFRLVASSSIVMPQEWVGPTLTEMAILDLTEFALHARRVIELTSLRDVKFPGCNLSHFNVAEVSGISFLDDFHECLNRLVHAKDVTIGYSIWEGPKRWLASPGERILSYATVGTDRRKPAHVNIFGIANCFLGEVLITVKERRPDYQF